MYLQSDVSIFSLLVVTAKSHNWQQIQSTIYKLYAKRYLINSIENESYMKTGN